MILTYHEIVAAPTPYLYATAAAQLREHLEVLERRTAEGLPECRVTFDDGHISQHSRGAAAIEEHGKAGIFFITSQWTGTAGYMTVAHLRELLRAGHEVQSHGWTHALLTQCSADALQQELTRSKGDLENWLGREVDGISMPGGAYNDEVLRACSAAGYRRVFVSEPWLKPGVRCGVMVEGRLMARNTMTAARLANLLDAEGRLLSAPRIGHAVRRAARATLGVSLYHSLWCWLARYRERTLAE